MSDLDLEQLMTDAVSAVDTEARPDQLAHRLRRVDRRRRAGVLTTMTCAVVALTMGVAAAWPDGPSPFELRVGDESPEQAAEDPHETEPAPDAEAVDTSDGDVVHPDEADHAAEVPDWTDDVASGDEPDQEPDPAPFVLDFGDEFTLAALAPTPAPEPAPHVDATPAPTHEAEPTTTPAPTKAKKKGRKKRGGNQQAVAFTAAAQYGSCEEPIPYDNYSGTAAAGATVTITSPWSASRTTTADAEGHWAMQVTYEAAPVGEPFTVTAASGGSSVNLSFVRTG